MKQILLRAVLALPMLAGAAFGQGPDGSDINKAIPIAFGQTASDIGDAKQVPSKVYKIVLARGQQIRVVSASTASSVFWRLQILDPSTGSLGAIQRSNVLESNGFSGANGLSLTYQVPVAGTYYIYLAFQSSGTDYTLQVTPLGTPIAVPNPTSAGCLTGKVDSITYSLQFIAVGLPDEVVIGGSRACASCTAKPPLYPEISDRLEAALRSNSAVEACYDSAGNIFQLKLIRQ